MGKIGRLAIFSGFFLQTGYSFMPDALFVNSAKNVQHFVHTDMQSPPCNLNHCFTPSGPKYLKEIQDHRYNLAYGSTVAEPGHTGLNSGLFNVILPSERAGSLGIAAVTSVLVIGTSLPVIGATTATLFVASLAYRGFRRISSQQIFYASSIASIVLVGIFGGISFSSGLCAIVA